MTRSERRIRLALFVLAAVAAGCAQLRESVTLDAIPAPKIGTLESAYDRAKWAWVRNADGRALLRHTEVRDCFVDPQPPLDVHGAGFTVKRHDKTIGGARYDVVTVTRNATSGKRSTPAAVRARPRSACTRRDAAKKRRNGSFRLTSKV